MSFLRIYSIIYICRDSCVYTYINAVYYIYVFIIVKVFAQNAVVYMYIAGEISHLIIKERLIHNYINSSKYKCPFYYLWYKANSRLIFIAVVAWGPFSVGEDRFLHDHFANCRKRSRRTVYGGGSTVNFVTPVQKWWNSTPMDRSMIFSAGETGLLFPL